MSNPPKSVTVKVDRRDDESCIRCGISLRSVTGSRHHRMPRQHGGHLVENLILLCGHGSKGCHWKAHNQPAKARALGLIIPAHSRITPADIKSIPVHTKQHGWVLLDGSDTYVPVAEAHARELLAVWGLLTPEAAA